MVLSSWTHLETVLLIDCLHEVKRANNWTFAERQDLTEQVQRKLEAAGFRRRSTKDIKSRIKHLGRTWTTTDKSDYLALYCYGWEALREECSRSVLESDPTGRWIPKKIIQPPSAPSNVRRNRSPEERHQTVTVEVPLLRPSCSPISEIERPPSLSRTSFDHSRCEEAQKSAEHNVSMDAIQKFLHDPAQYFSSRTDVGNARSRLTTQIEDAVTRLLRASRTLPMKSPDWNSWFKNPLFVTLLCKVYGTVTKEELLNVIPSNFPQSVLSQEQLLRALLGAVISHWVFERQHSLILKDPTERERNSTEDDLARVYPALLEQSLRRAKFDFVKRRTGLDNLANQLAKQFFYETCAILPSNLTNFSDAASEWSETLRTIFTTALELDGQLLLWATQFEVIWPTFGEIADPMFMKIEGMQGSTQKCKVLATLFPAIIEVGMDRMSMSKAQIEEGVVLRSLVLPQKSYEQPATRQNSHLEDL